MAWLDIFKKGLKKTADVFTLAKRELAHEEALEDILLQSDMGYQTVQNVLEHIKKGKTNEEKLLLLRETLCTILKPIARPLDLKKGGKYVILLAGVNGAGKTTTAGKLAYLCQQQGFKTALVAADTFRAGATQQLQLWGDKISCPVFVTRPGGDAAGLVFDALKNSLEQETDIVIIDTAGRLQNKKDLMEELAKINRTLQKFGSSFHQETILVLDACVGQNALNQVRLFQEVTPLSGLIMTKLDGTAKGGILLALAQEFSLPIYAVGVGEGLDDFHPFTAENYVDCLLGLQS